MTACIRDDVTDDVRIGVVVATLTDSGQTAIADVWRCCYDNPQRSDPVMTDSRFISYRYEVDDIDEEGKE